MLRSRLHLLLLMPFLLLTMAFRQAPLVDPEPISAPAKATEEQVGKAIELSLARLGWMVTDKKPGHIDSTLHLREHTAVIGIDYDRQRVQIHYVSSINLKYEESRSGKQIHKNYLGWIQNLCNEIRSSLILVAG